MESEIRLLLNRKDKLALEYLYDCYAPALYGAILRLVKDRADSERLLHKTFLTIWQQVGSNDYNNKSLFVWMHNIARDVAMHELNKQISESKPHIQNSRYSGKWPAISSFGSSQ